MKLCPPRRQDGILIQSGSSEEERERKRKRDMQTERVGKRERQRENANQRNKIRPLVWRRTEFQENGPASSPQAPERRVREGGEGGEETASMRWMTSCSAPYSPDSQSLNPSTTPPSLPPSLPPTTHPSLHSITLPKHPTQPAGPR